MGLTRDPLNPRIKIKAQNVTPVQVEKAQVEWSLRQALCLCPHLGHSSVITHNGDGTGCWASSPRLLHR